MSCLVPVARLSDPNHSGSRELASLLRLGPIALLGSTRRRNFSGPCSHQLSVFCVKSILSFDSILGYRAKSLPHVLSIDRSHTAKFDLAHPTSSLGFSFSDTTRVAAQRNSVCRKLPPSCHRASHKAIAILDFTSLTWSSRPIRVQHERSTAKQHWRPSAGTRHRGQR